MMDRWSAARSLLWSVRLLRVAWPRVCPHLPRGVQERLQEQNFVGNRHVSTLLPPANPAAMAGREMSPERRARLEAVLRAEEEKTLLHNKARPPAQPTPRRVGAPALCTYVRHARRPILQPARGCWPPGWCTERHCAGSTASLLTPLSLLPPGEALRPGEAEEGGRSCSSGGGGRRRDAGVCGACACYQPHRALERTPSDALSAPGGVRWVVSPDVWRFK